MRKIRRTSRSLPRCSRSAWGGREEARKQREEDLVACAVGRFRVWPPHEFLFVAGGKQGERSREIKPLCCVAACGWPPERLRCADDR
jgi:hypothetical protein